MSYYKNFADGMHIKEKNIVYNEILAVQNEFEKIRDELVLSFVPQGQNIKLLEIGSGKGTFARACEKRGGIQYFGIEPQKKLCDQLGAKGYYVKQIFVPPIPFEKEIFDAVVHSHVLEHMDNPRQAYEFISDCAKVLKKGGVLIFRCPNALTWGMDFWDIDYTHCFVTSPTRIKQLLYDCDFKINYFEELSFFKPRHFGKLKYLIPRRINFLNKLYPKISKFLGRFFKKDTELFFVCQKYENTIN